MGKTVVSTVLVTGASERVAEVSSALRKAGAEVTAVDDLGKLDAALAGLPPARWTATSRCRCMWLRAAKPSSNACATSWRTDCRPASLPPSDPAGDVRRGPGRAGRGQHLHWFRLVPSDQVWQGSRPDRSGIALRDVWLPCGR